MLRTWFMPNAIGVVLWIILVTASTLPRDLISAGMVVNVLFWRLGLPTVVDEPRYFTLERDVLVERRLELLATAAGIYIVVTPLGRLGSGGWGRLRDAPRPRGWRRPGAVFAIVVVATLLAALVAAMIVSRRTWGYYMWRPRLDARVRGATKVVSCRAFDTEPRSGSEALRLIVKPEADIYQWGLARDERERGDYYSHTTRALAALRQRNLLVRNPPRVEPERLAPIHARLDAIGLLDAGDPDYMKWLGARGRAKHLRGFAVEFHGPRGEPLMLICAAGGEAANDTFPYYEFLFAADSDPPKLLGSVKFYYDSAGIEGFEWPAIWTAFAGMGLAVIVPLTLVVMVVRRLLEHRRQPGRGFPVQLVGE